MTFINIENTVLKYIWRQKYIFGLLDTPPREKACSQKRGNVANARNSRLQPLTFATLPRFCEQTFFLGGVG